MKPVRSNQMQIRLTPAEMKNIKAACAPLGMKPTTYVRTVLLRELAAAFPEDSAANTRMLEQVAEMAGQVIRKLSEAEAPKKVK